MNDSRRLLTPWARPCDVYSQPGRVLLKLNSNSLQLLERLAPYQRRINDVLFEFLDEKRFRELRALASKLVACGDRAVAMTALLVHEAEVA